MADQGEADVVDAGPFRMLTNCTDHVGWQRLAGENLQDLRFGKIGVVEHDGKKLRMTFGKERARDARGPTPGQRDFLADWKLRQPGEELIFCDAFSFGGGAGKQGELGQVHQVKIADEAKAWKAWSAGMEGKGALDAIVLKETLAARDFFEDFCWEIFAVEEQTKLRFVQSGIVEEGEQDGWIGMREQDGEIVADGDERAFAVLRNRIHGDSLPSVFHTSI